MLERLGELLRLLLRGLWHLLRNLGPNLRGLWRLLRLLGHVCVGLWMVYVSLPRCSPRQRAQTVQDWNQALLRLCAVRIDRVGEPYAQGLGPVLWVANHISWLDIVALHACAFSRFVAKHEVSGWPVVGRMARAVDTLFIRRGAKGQTQMVVRKVAEALRGDDRITVFPEGITTKGDTVLPFGRRIPAAAWEVGCPIQPIAITYLNRRGQFSDVAGWGDEPFLAVFWRVLCGSGLTVRVQYGSVFKPTFESAAHQTLAADLRSTIMQMRQPWMP